MGANPIEPLLAGAGRLRDDEVARAATDAAAAALAPFADEAAHAALRWAARRWPEFTRETVLPELEDAVGPAEEEACPAHSEHDPRPLVAGALVAAGAVAAALLARRR